MNYSTGQIWLIIALLGAGTFLIRYSFIGLIGDRPLPAWLMRTLRYTPVAVLPGLVAPLVLWPAATSGSFDPARGLAALLTIAIGLATRSVMKGFISGVVVLYVGLWVF